MKSNLVWSSFPFPTSLAKCKISPGPTDSCNCSWFNARFHCHDDGCSTNPWNVGPRLREHTVLHPRSCNLQLYETICINLHCFIKLYKYPAQCRLFSGVLLIYYLKIYFLNITSKMVTMSSLTSSLRATWNSVLKAHSNRFSENMYIT
jgi:hypothetical protein